MALLVRGVALQLLLLAALSAQLVLARQGSFRGGTASTDEPVDNTTVSAGEVELSLRTALDAVLGLSADTSKQVSKRLAVIEGSMWPTFQALPKNDHGRLAPRAVRHLVRTFFLKEHGWLLKGLEPSAAAVSESSADVLEADVLRAKVPALVEAALEAREAGRGLSLEEVVAMAAALERLIFDESVGLLQAAYELNDLDSSMPLDQKGLQEVLVSYLLLVGQGGTVNATAAGHRAWKEAKLARGVLNEHIAFSRDATLTFDFRHRHGSSPFASGTYEFDAAAAVVEDIAQNYGRWQDTDCQTMRSDLESMDPAGTGRIPLGRFYKHPGRSSYSFTESTTYLRSVGALEEAGDGSSFVRIANYMAGPSNCVAHSSYFSVCCLSLCDSIMSELEGMLKAPAVAPERLLAAVWNLTASTSGQGFEDEDGVEGPPARLRGPEGPALEERLKAIASRNGGEVPLHGRLFEQWLHFAFPRECPHPLDVNAETFATASPAHWLPGGAGGSASADREERERHIIAKAAAQNATAAVAAPQWTEEEVLPLLEPTVRTSGNRYAPLVALLALAAAVLRFGWEACRTAIAAKHGHNDKTWEKQRGCLLPMYH